jgi:hypothetical protein
MTSTFSGAGTTSHSTLVSGFTNGQAYTYYIKCQDTAGNPNTDDYTISFSVGAAAAGTCQAGLVLLQHFDSNMFDSSGNGNNGSCTNCPTYTTSGKFSGALSFDGTNDVVNVPDSNSLDTTSNVTISVWIYPRSWGNYNEFAKKDGNYILRRGRSTGDYDNAALIWFNGTQVLSLKSASSPSLNAWHHIVGVVQNNAPYKLYIDGADSGSASGITSTAARNLNNILQIGGATNEFFNGTLDDVRIYNYALNGSEILSLYQSSPSCIHKSELPLCDGCVEETELLAFIARWKINSSDPTLKELMEAIGLWKRGCP